MTPARLAVVVVAVTIAVMMTSAASAQQSLVVNGHSIAVDTRLIPGTSLAPAPDYAAALGARYAYNRRLELVSFQHAGSFATLIVYDEARAAYGAKTPLRVDGTPYESVGGVLLDGVPYIPVKSLATAFGGSVDYLTGRNTVVVVFPRARLETLTRPDVAGDYERIVLDFSGPVPVEYRENPGGSVSYIFDRVRVDEAEAFGGRFFTEARLDNSTGTATLWLEPLPNTRTESFASQADGFQWIVDIIPGDDVLPDDLPLVVLDPGHGGTDNGFVFPGVDRESVLTLALARDLAQRLREDGYRVTLTRDSDVVRSAAERSDAAIGADLFLSLHGAPLAAGTLNLYYLGDASHLDSLSMAVRQNAATALRNSNSSDDSRTAALRRRILLGLIPDITRGSVLARDLSAELGQNAGLRAAERAALPLYVLGGAAGRGLMLELSPDDLVRPDLADTLAAAINQLVPLE